jgi:hypothetical protein
MTEGIKKTAYAMHGGARQERSIPSDRSLIAVPVFLRLMLRNGGSTFFSGSSSEKNSRLSVLGLERFDDG